jgi:hypothetical protein
MLILHDNDCKTRLDTAHNLTKAAPKKTIPAAGFTLLQKNPTLAPLNPTMAKWNMRDCDWKIHSAAFARGLTVTIEAKWGYRREMRGLRK